MFQASYLLGCYRLAHKQTADAYMPGWVLHGRVSVRNRCGARACGHVLYRYTPILPAGNGCYCMIFGMDSTDRD